MGKLQADTPPPNPTPSQERILDAIAGLLDRWRKEKKGRKGRTPGVRALSRELGNEMGGIGPTLKRMERDEWITLPKVTITGELGLTAKAKRWLARRG